MQATEKKQKQRPNLLLPAYKSTEKPGRFDYKLVEEKETTVVITTVFVKGTARRRRARFPPSVNMLTHFSGSEIHVDPSHVDPFQETMINTGKHCTALYRPLRALYTKRYDCPKSPMFRDRDRSAGPHGIPF